MYASVIALAWGFFFRDPSWLAAFLAATATAFCQLTARADEAECLAYFGRPYAEYMARTRRFIPFLY
jgi:protein-S-isoprenylcysteine O-methyltransferase Ste14